MTVATSLDISLTVNGGRVAGRVEPRTQLCEFLREDLNLTGTHVGCQQGVCGACTVLVDGRPQRSCISFGGDCDGSDVTTIEGLDADPLAAELRDAFTRHHALQCGFCTPGMLITARDIVARLGEVDVARIREELSGNICRCTGYVGIVEAIEEVSRGKRARPPSPMREVAPLQAGSPASIAPAHPAPAAISSVSSGKVRKGWSAIDQALEIGHPPDVVWSRLSDIRAVALCLPGAEVTSLEGERIEGRMNVALGPMRVAFAGTGLVHLDAAERTGRMAGGGRDTGSGSAAEGEVTWRVRPSPTAGATVTRLDVNLAWRLSGRLAQFNRPGLVADIVGRMASAFVANLDASLAGREMTAAKPLGLWSLVWSIVKSRFGRSA